MGSLRAVGALHALYGDRQRDRPAGDLAAPVPRRRWAADRRAADRTAGARGGAPPARSPARTGGPLGGADAPPGGRLTAGSAHAEHGALRPADRRVSRPRARCTSAGLPPSQPTPSTARIGLGTTPSRSASAVPWRDSSGTSSSSASSQVANA